MQLTAPSCLKHAPPVAFHSPPRNAVPTSSAPCPARTRGWLGEYEHEKRELRGRVAVYPCPCVGNFLSPRVPPVVGLSEGNRRGKSEPRTGRAWRPQHPRDKNTVVSIVRYVEIRSRKKSHLFNKWSTALKRDFSRGVKVASWLHAVRQGRRKAVVKGTS